VSWPRVLPFKNSLMERDFRTRARQDLITLESPQMRRMVRPDDAAGPILMGVVRRQRALSMTAPTIDLPRCCKGIFKRNAGGA
jgi:hypothetical protein